MANRISKGLQILFVGFSVSSAQPGDTLFVEVGSRLLEYSRIQERTDTLELFVTRNDTITPISTLVKTVRREMIGDEATWIISQYYASARGVNIDTSFVRVRDLRPIRYTAVVGGEVQRFVFGPNKIDGEVISPTGIRRTVTEELSHPVFNAVADHELISTLPLRDSLTATYEAYNPPRGFGRVIVRVRGKKIVMTSTGKETAWEVEYAGEGAPTTIWISVKDHLVLGLRSDLRGGRVFWRIPAKEKEAWIRGKVVG